MTVAEILKQAQKLSAQERKEVAMFLLNSVDVVEKPSNAKTGAEIVAMLEQMEPIEFVDPEITDPVEWVKAQRRKEEDRLKSYWDDEQ